MVSNYEKWNKRFRFSDNTSQLQNILKVSHSSVTSVLSMLGSDVM